MNKSYHKTDPALNSEEVSRRELSAQSQETTVLGFFMLFTGGNFTPDEVLRSLTCGILPMLNVNTPITSIRRAITNLEKRGLLRKTEIRRPTPRGATSRTWIWQEPVEPGQGNLF